MVRTMKAIGVTLAALFVGPSSALTFTPHAISSGTITPIGVWNLGESDAVRQCPFAVSLESRNIASPSMTRMAAGPAVLDKTIVEKKTSKAPEKEKKRTSNQGWEVRIYNDGKNTREHVARCLVRVTGLSEASAYETMMQAHQYGIAVVGRWMFERAEMYYEALKVNGIVCDMVPVEEDKK
jgi:ATP-dependent Clp protease adapter protein ClpS